MRILHIAAEITDDGNGLAEYVRLLSSTQRAMGDDVTVLTHAGICDFSLPQPRHTNFLYFSKTFTKEMEYLSGKVDFIHIHGSWTFPVWYAAKCASLSGVPYCVTPQGSFDPVRLAHSAWKKRLATPFDQSVLKEASFIQATNEQEVKWCCDFAAIPPKKVHVIPLGIETPHLLTLTRTAKLSNNYLYLGRLHPLKGINLLLEAFAAAKVGERGATLTICGRDEESTLSKLQSLSHSLGIAKCIRFLPPVKSSDKWKLINESDLVILPSLSDNFGIIVGEALFSHKPVIATTATPWNILEKERCGYYVAPNATAIETAITSFFNRSQEERTAMGNRGASYVSENLSYEAIALKLKELYQRYQTRK